MKTLVALFLALALPLAANSRSPVDDRHVAGVAIHEGGIDVYTVRHNEFATPIEEKIWRTTLSHDGTLRLSRELVEHSASFARVVGQHPNVHMIWPGRDYQILTSRIEHGVLKYRDGKLAAEHGMYPAMSCNATECVVVYDVAGRQHATLLDTDGNAIGPPIALPAGFHPMRVSLDERGILFVRVAPKELRAALVRRDGSVQYDTVVATTRDLVFPSAPIGITSNGAHDVVVFSAYAQVRAVTISADGTVSAPVELLPTGFAPLDLTWNGSVWLLSGYAPAGRFFVMRFDSAFQPLDAEPFLGTGQPFVQADGANFAIVWDNYPAAYLTILRSDGHMTAPLPIDPVVRRRSVR